MVESGISPNDRVMADFARGGESGGHVSRVGGARVIFLMAGIAENAVQRVVVVDVAVTALPGRDGVRSG